MSYFQRRKEEEKAAKDRCNQALACVRMNRSLLWISSVGLFHRSFSQVSFDIYVVSSAPQQEKHAAEDRYKLVSFIGLFCRSLLQLFNMQPKIGATRRMMYMRK